MVWSEFRRRVASGRRRGLRLEQLHHRLIILRTRDRQRRLTRLALGGDVSTRLEEQCDELGLVGSRRDHERRDAALVAGIHVRPALQYHLGGGLRLAGHGATYRGGTPPPHPTNDY